MKTFLLKKIYITILAALLYIITVNAQIVYTDVNPNITLDTNGALYNLNINNDGIADFKFDYNYRIYNCQCLMLRTSGDLSSSVVVPLNSNSMMAFTNAEDDIIKLNANTIIDSSLHWENYELALTAYGGFCNACSKGTIFSHVLNGGIWDGSTDKYMGLQVKIGSNIYYGWVRLNVGIEANFVTIKDYAYNTVPNQPILAGQKTVFNYIVPSAIASPPYCAGNNIHVTYKTHGTFNASNIFTAQLSDSSGSFANPVVIGTKQSAVNGTINAVIPSRTRNGSKYRIRVVSSQHSAYRSFDNGTNLRIGIPPIIITASGGVTEFCSGGSATLLAPKVSGYTYQWLKNGTIINSATSATIVIDSTGNFQCVVTNACGIDTSNTIVVTVYPLPYTQIAALGPTIFCEGDSVKLCVTNPSVELKYQWWNNNRDNGIILGARDSFYVADTSGEYYVITSTKKRCSSYSNFIDVFQAKPPQETYIYFSGDTNLCKGDSILLEVGSPLCYDCEFQWKKNGTNIPGATINYYYAKTSGTYKVQESNMCGSTITAGVTLTTKQCLMSNSSTNDGTIISKIPQLKIAPNPFSNTTTISFSLTQSQKVSIQIFDATGRLIKTLADAQMQAGAHQLVWNAKDEKGNAVTTGVYFLKMQTGNYSETKKIVVAR